MVNDGDSSLQTTDWPSVDYENAPNLESAKTECLTHWDSAAGEFNPFLESDTSKEFVMLCTFMKTLYPDDFTTV